MGPVSLARHSRGSRPASQRGLPTQWAKTYQGPHSDFAIGRTHRLAAGPGLCQSPDVANPFARDHATHAADLVIWGRSGCVLHSGRTAVIFRRVRSRWIAPARSCAQSAPVR